MSTTYPALSRKELGWTLVVLLLVFAFINGPVWAGPWDATPSIIASYLPIPFVVAALLVRHRALRFRPWLLHTLELTGVKFMITAIFLVVLWMIRGAPPPTVARLLESRGIARSAPKLADPTPVPSEQKGTLEGRVVAGSEPLAGALVLVTSGLEGMRFSPREDEVRLSLGSEGYEPRVAAVQVGQPLVLSVRGQGLHTAQGVGSGGAALFNIPVLPKAAGAKHVFYDAAGPVEIRCTVHGKAEPSASLWVLWHPFFTTTDAQGRFSLPGVPKRPVTLLARDPATGRQTQLENSQPGTVAELSMPPAG
jgi:hypothetical protein